MPSWVLQVGTGGAFLLVALFIIGKFYLPNKSRGHCVNSPQVRKALESNRSTKESMDRVERAMNSQVKEQIETTLILRMIHDESKEQTKALITLAKNNKR